MIREQHILNISLSIMCTKTATFDIDKTTKNYKKIIDLGTYKGSGVGYDYGAA